MTLDNYYLHAIDSYGKYNPFDIELTLNKLEEILSSGYILSRRQMGDTNTRIGGWNGLDYISLCDYKRRNNKPYYNDKDYTAYELYIRTSLSFMFLKKSIKAIDTILKPPIENDTNKVCEMITLGNHPTKRYSDYPDEVQVKNKISLKKTEGITIPFDRLIDEDCNYVYSTEQIIEFLKKIKEVLNYYNIKKPIYDLLTQKEIKNENDLEKILIRN